MSLSWIAAAAQGVPNIPVKRSPSTWLQIGNPNEAHWLEDNRWGAGSITEGTAATQYEQSIGGSSTVGPNGEVAFRMKWRWPNPPGAGEVKAFPQIVTGRKPGYHSHSNYVDNKPVYKTDGSMLTASPSGHTPGTIFPLQLPLQSLKAKVAHAHLSPPTGQGQLTFDIWLQSSPKQDAGFVRSSITHEIMIPLSNWGGYGAHNTPGGRNPGWYDHTATIGGKVYHVYITKHWQSGEFLYNFGRLDGSYGRTGWKMLAFVPAVLPVPAGEIDLAAIINYIGTRKDSRGNPWGTGKEYLASVELGVEPVQGTGDIVVYDYKISAGGTTAAAAAPPAPAAAPAAAPTPAPAPAPASPPSAGSCSTAQNWVDRQYYAAGSIVTYNGAQYVAKFANPGYNPTISTYFWARHNCGTAPAPAPAQASAPTPAQAPAPTTTWRAPVCALPAWSATQAYSSGALLQFEGMFYNAQLPSTAKTPSTSPSVWSRYTNWQSGERYTGGSVVAFEGKMYVAKHASSGKAPTTDTHHWAPYNC